VRLEEEVWRTNVNVDGRMDMRLVDRGDVDCNEQRSYTEHRSTETNLVCSMNGSPHEEPHNGLATCSLQLYECIVP